MAPPRPRPCAPLLGLAVGLLVFACTVAASELGRPLLRVFPRQEHKAHVQFHAPTQSPTGLMYFGNQMAVMEYDGRTWRILKVPLPYVRALALAPSGAIYVGDEEQLGSIPNPALPEPAYVSLLERVPAAAKPFGFVRDVRSWRGDIYFATDRSLLRWREVDATFRVWPLAGDTRNRLFVVADRLVLHREGLGLFELASDELIALSTAPAWQEPGAGWILPWTDGRLLVGVGQRGLFLLNRDGALQPWQTEADAILARSAMLAGERLHDGSVAIGTVSEGLVILNAEGRLVRHLARDTGLPHATVFALHEDREAGLWVCTNNAPARVHWRSAATVFDHQTGGISDARANDLTRHDGVLYYLSNDGLYRLAPSADSRVPARFERDPRVDVQTKLSSLLSHPGGLLLAGGRGLQRLGREGLELLTARPDGLLGLSASKTESGRIFFAHARGIGTGVFSNDGHWHDEGDIAGIDAECYDVVEDNAGVLWVGSISKGVYRATRGDGRQDWRQAHVERLTTAADLPENHGAIYLAETPLGLLFDTAHGIYRYDPASRRFAPYAELTAFATEPVVLNPLVGGAPGEIWANGLATDIKTKRSPYPLVRLRIEAGGTVSAQHPPPEIEDFFVQPPHRIVWEAGAAPSAGVLWAKSDDGLLRIDLARYGTRGPTPTPLVRQFSAEGREIGIPRDPAGPVRINYSREPISLSWVSGAFRRPEAERFQTRLLGFNEQWSVATARHEIAFTNLEGGPFRFEVRSVDRQGSPGAVTGLSFAVTPPWQRSGWAYAAYSIVGFGAIAGFVRWRLQRGERERQRLERLVAERTGELRTARDAADAANRAKSTFLANMSHELRTPLNGVIGYAQVLAKDRELSGRNRERLRIIQTSGEHLLRMINEVLDFSKIEAGKMELAPAPFQLPQLLRDIAAAVRVRAQQKELEFGFDAAPDLPEFVLGDSVKLRQVLENLLSNALKFTPACSVRLEVRPAGSERIAFSVSDTGVGISAADRVRLFQPFQQAVDGRPPEPGTGLGLAISRRLVELMGGELAVESHPGQGSRFRFTVTLPTLAVEPSETRPAAKVVTGYHGRRRRLLVVDDVGTNRDVLRDLLTPLGFEISEASSGVEALAVVNAVKPDLVFVDLRMPGIDGFELTRRLRERSGGTSLKIIAMSASVLSFNRDDAFAAGCDDFLPKPFREADLLARLQLALQLEWIGETRRDPAPAGSASPFAVHTRVPLDELRELLAAARRGEIAVLKQSLERWRGDTFADSLLLLAKSYQMERIREALEQRTAAARVD